MIGQIVNYLKYDSLGGESVSMQYQIINDLKKEMKDIVDLNKKEMKDIVDLNKKEMEELKKEFKELNRKNKTKSVFNDRKIINRAKNGEDLGL